MTKVVKKVQLNGVEKMVEASPESRLLDVIRLELNLTGTKEGCGEGECGACSILINDTLINSCLVLFGQLNDGDKILTVEGLGDAKHLTSLQECFITEGGTQCGMCTPGMLIAAHALLIKNPKPTREEIAEALAGNLCRCTGYKKIIDSVEKAAKIMRGES
ncbi:MAG: (2Fe-2S)-binding protein [Deltaproteobacteria bacterium]|jgi:aerobic carbon-monoxide dehydrogenase small subunit|nr:(2Fe-2S)-binding protein [Deltaproteobacteria bacterium]